MIVSKCLGDMPAVMPRCLPPATWVVCTWKVLRCRLSCEGWFNLNFPLCSWNGTTETETSLEVLWHLRNNWACLPVSLVVVNLFKMAFDQLKSFYSWIGNEASQSSQARFATTNHANYGQFTARRVDSCEEVWAMVRDAHHWALTAMALPKDKVERMSHSFSCRCSGSCWHSGSCRCSGS